MRTILVAGATGNTGSKVVQQLSASGQATVRAMVRNPDADAAKGLAALPNVTLVKADMEDPASLKQALAGAERAFLVSTPGEDTQYDREVAFIAAAAEASLEVVVRISTWSCLIGLDVECVYARAHARIEKYIEEHKSKVVDLQPDWFTSNLLWQAAEAKASGKITYPVTPEQGASGKFAAIDPRDVAGAAVAILLAPKDLVDSLLAARMLEVHGPEEITFNQYLEAVSAACGKKIELNPISPDGFVEMLVGFGMTPIMSKSFKDTILTAVGAKEGARPKILKNSEALAAIWKPKHTLAEWAKENAAAFA